ncbi:hypothetical protein XENOCAPTIV_011417 [Xenoophorus captivus]|uniref:Uncharacterized protein n=1 Tax=Xenoophorus captivus TaxID=1517983 RepID=A0ABV0RI54_9TELE
MSCVPLHCPVKDRQHVQVPWRKLFSSFTKIGTDELTKVSQKLSEKNLNNIVKFCHLYNLVHPFSRCDQRCFIYHRSMAIPTLYPLSARLHQVALVPEPTDVISIHLQLIFKKIHFNFGIH